MDSGEFNKIFGGILAAFLVLLLLNFAAGKIYGTGGHHGDEQLAFAVEVQETTGGDPKDDVAIDYSALLASADAAAGQKQFNKCKSCHKVEEGADGVGPNLWGIVGRDIGGVEGYSYSGILTELPGDWTLTALSEFLESPKKYAKGTKMAFGGLKKPQDRVNLIVYLNEADGTPEALE